MQKRKPGTNNAYPYILCALFAALTAVCTFINIPLPFTPIPINLATLSVFLAGGLLGAKYGALSQIVYVLVGAVGIPVFAGFQGGFGVLAGPTGGFLIGYVTAAFLIGLMLNNVLKLNGKPTVNVIKIVISCIIGMITYFALGTAWFMISTGSALVPALVACVLPFLIGDLLKITAATLLIVRLRKTTSVYLSKSA